MLCFRITDVECGPHTVDDVDSAAPTEHDLGEMAGTDDWTSPGIVEVRLGQAVTLKARAFPGKSFTGTVTSIAAAAIHSEQNGQSRITVATELENPGLLLKPQMTGTAKIHCGERRAIALLTRRLVRYLRVEFWSWW